jgi:hypothetical protein
MAVQLAQRPRHAIWVAPQQPTSALRTFSGVAGPLIINGSTDAMVGWSGISGSNGTFVVIGAATVGVTATAAFIEPNIAGYGEYSTELVASLLQADAEPPEASFDNVVDMLSWLNRD